MASRVVSVLRLVVDANNELGSWNKFLKRCDIAVINVDFSDKLPKGASESVVREAIRNEDHRKGAALLNAIGEEGMAIFDTFDIAVQEIGYKDLIKRFEQHFGHRENVIILRHRFLGSRQSEGESVSSFIRRVSVAAGACELGALREDMIVQVVIKGMESAKLRGELLITADLDLAKLKEICSRFECADRTEDVLRGREIEVDRVRGERVTAEVLRVTLGRCFKCGNEGHFARSCPKGESKAIVCFKCGKEGHIYRFCPEAPRVAKVKCFRCSEEGHFARICPKREHKAIVCFRCNREGHISRFCPEGSGRIVRDIICFGCGQKGHMAAQCSDRKDAQSVTRVEEVAREGRGKRMTLISTSEDPLDEEL